MSIVLAVKKNHEIVVAADSQTNFGSQVVTFDNHSVSKIRSVADSLLASTGWSLYDNIFDDFLERNSPKTLADRKAIFSFFLKLWREMGEKYSLVNEQCNEDDSPFGDLDASFLVVNRSGIFHISSDMSVVDFRQYYAIGSGSDYSMGAMHALYNQDLDAETIARRAIEAAIALNVYCGGETQVHKISFD